MKTAKFISAFLLFLAFQDGYGIDDLGTFLYNDLRCTTKEGTPLQYECPDFSIKNGSCLFKNKILKEGERVDKELLKGSCNAHCICGSEGRLICAQYDCFERLKSGCSHFMYSLDTCCAVDSVCGPIAKCKVDGDIYQEGEKIFPKNTCDECVCVYKSHRGETICRPRKCYDQINYLEKISNYGAPIFSRDEKCCPISWTSDEGENIIKINSVASVDSKVSCKYGNRTIKLGYGFEKSTQPYGKLLSLKCECTIPPFVICMEK